VVTRFQRGRNIHFAKKVALPALATSTTAEEDQHHDPGLTRSRSFKDDTVGNRSVRPVPGPVGEQLPAIEIRREPLPDTAVQHRSGGRRVSRRSSSWLPNTLSSLLRWASLWSAPSP
jgi:hypothetical protein